MSPRTRTEVRSKLALAVRNNAPQDEIEQLRRDYHAAKLEEQAREVAAKFPPLTDAQIAAIDTALRGGAS